MRVAMAEPQAGSPQPGTLPLGWGNRASRGRGLPWPVPGALKRAASAVHLEEHETCSAHGTIYRTKPGTNAGVQSEREDQVSDRTLTQDACGL